MQVGFDGMAWPVDKPIVTIEAERGPVQGAGITWSENTITVEFQIRGLDPFQFHMTEQEDGSYEVIAPPVYLPNPKEF